MGCNPTAHPFRKVSKHHPHDFRFAAMPEPAIPGAPQRERQPDPVPQFGVNTL